MDKERNTGAPQIADPLAEVRRGREGELLRYDYFKHLTSLSLLSLGGMITLAGSLFPAAATERGFVLAIALMAAAGFVAFAAMIELVDAVARERRPRWTAGWAWALAPALFGAGVGAFLSLL